MDEKPSSLQQRTPGGHTMSNDHLHILWTNDNPLTAENMVMLYAINAKKKNWWQDVTVIIWGATAKIAVENELLKGLIQDGIENGVHFSACKACADKLGTTDRLLAMGVEVLYWGEPLTKLIKDAQPLLTV